MKEIMIPTFIWDDEKWVLKKVKNLTEGFQELMYCDGSVRNIIFDIDDTNNLESGLTNLFSKYKWIDKIIVFVNGETYGVYKSTR